MGKYVRDEKDFDQYRFFLCAMANELAEANRLKRLELKDKYTHFDDAEGIYCSNKKELEDQA